MMGGLGDDAYVVDNAADTVAENAGEGSDTVFASVNYALNIVETLVLQGGADLQLRQRPDQRDLRQYRQQPDRWRRRRRRHERGCRQRHLFRRQCRRRGDRERRRGQHTVSRPPHLALAANVENLVLQGGADLQGYGNDLADALFGNSGNNLLDGDAGADAMSGGAGNDPTSSTSRRRGERECQRGHRHGLFEWRSLRLTANRGKSAAARLGRPAGFRQRVLSNAIYGNTGDNLLDGDVGNNFDVWRGRQRHLLMWTTSLTWWWRTPTRASIPSTPPLTWCWRRTAETLLILDGSADLQGFGNGLG